MWYQTVNALRTEFSTCGMGVLCGLFGKSRQGWYQYKSDYYRDNATELMILKAAHEIRDKAPRIGCLKLHYMISNMFRGEDIPGRDHFYKLLRDNGMMLRKRKSRKTTNSNHHYRKFENLIKDFSPTRPNMLWVSDITYIETEDGVVYLSLITDAYSHKIVGWSVGETLEALYPLQALNMALQTREESFAWDLIHHSDRGVQYCSHKYVDLLQNQNIRISMTQSGDPLENAVAERINGILKSEWVYHVRLKNLIHAKEYLNEIITYYNQNRPHLSINMMTPDQAHRMQGEIEKKWKNYYKPKEERDIA